MSYPPNFDPQSGQFYHDPRHTAADRAWVPESHPHHSNQIPGQSYPVYPPQPQLNPFDPDQLSTQQGFGSPAHPYHAAYGQQQPSFDQPGHLFGDHLAPYPGAGATQGSAQRQGGSYSPASSSGYGFAPAHQYSPGPAPVHPSAQAAPLPHSLAPELPLGHGLGPAIPQPVASDASTAAAPPKSLKIKLRVSRQPESATEIGTQAGEMSRRSSANAAAVTAQQYSYSSGRPTRAARAEANYKMQQIHDDEPSDQDAEGEEEADEQDDGYDERDNGYGQPEEVPYEDNQLSRNAKLHALQEARKSQRERKQPQRLADSDIYDTNQAARSSSGRRRSQRNEDDEEDGDQYAEQQEQEAYQPPRNAFPSRTTRSTRASEAQAPVADAGLPLFNDDSDDYREAKPARKAKKGKKRAAASQRSGYGRSDAEDSFEPSDDDDGSDEDADSEDPINGYEVDDDDDADRDEDDFIVTSSPQSRRKQNSRSQRGPTRRSTRATAHHDTEDESPGAKRPNLRAKKAVNYALPPADISTELTGAMTNDAIAAVSKPNGRARSAAGPSRFMNKTFSFNLGGQDIAQAMGEPDSSDSVGHRGFAGWITR